MVRVNVSTAHINNGIYPLKSIFPRKDEKIFNINGVNSKFCYYCDQIQQENICHRMKSDSIERRRETVTILLSRKKASEIQVQKEKPCAQNGCKFLHHPMLHEQLENCDEADSMDNIDEWCVP